MRYGKHLTCNSFGIYSYRKTVPKHLRKIIKKSTLKKSLGTADYHAAVRLATIINAFVEIGFKQMSKKGFIPGLSELKFSGLHKTKDSWSVDSIEFDSSADPETEIKLYNAFVDGMNASVSSSSQSLKELPKEEPKEPLLSELRDLYFREKQKKVKPETLGVYSQAIDTLIELAGDVPPSSLTHEQIVEICELIQKIPKQANWKIELRDKPLRQVIDQGGYETLLLSNACNRIQRISTFFNWLVKRRKLEVNYFEGQGNYKYKGSGWRYSEEDLQTLYLDTTYSKGHKQHPWKYWVPLLALYQGTRLTETCQFSIDDYQIIRNIPCLMVNDLDDKSTKNHESCRHIPIHSELIRLGFLDYLNALSVAGENRFFPTLIPCTKGKLSTKMDEHWRKYRRGLGIMHPKKNFHSLRHTFTDTLKQLYLPEALASQLIGHESGQTNTYIIYGTNYIAPALQPSLEKLCYSITGQMKKLQW